ncbi:hypothetical protein PPUN15366_12780 [Pseudomonas putida]|nr:hypothetical protein PPUN15366_12780 [Pseudomonas putida]
MPSAGRTRTRPGQRCACTCPIAATGYCPNRPDTIPCRSGLVARRAAQQPLDFSYRIAGRGPLCGPFATQGRSYKENRVGPCYQVRQILPKCRLLS